MVAEKQNQEDLQQSSDRMLKIKYEIIFQKEKFLSADFSQRCVYLQ